FRDPLQREPELAALFRPAVLGGDAADQPDLRMRRLRRHPADHWSALTRHRRHLLLVPAGEAAPRLPVPGARRDPAAIRQREYHARPDRLLGSLSKATWEVVKDKFWLGVNEYYSPSWL